MSVLPENVSHRAHTQDHTKVITCSLNKVAEYGFMCVVYVKFLKLLGQSLVNLIAHNNVSNMLKNLY